MSQKSLLSRSLYPALSGLFAFLAGFSGKHAFSDDIGGLAHYEILQGQTASYAARLVFLLLMLYLNSLMLKFFVSSLQANGATLTTVMNFSFNFILSGISSFIYFNEKLGMNWFIGVSMILAGISILAYSKNQDTQPKTKKD